MKLSANLAKPDRQVSWQVMMVPQHIFDIRRSQKCLLLKKLRLSFHTWIKRCNGSWGSDPPIGDKQPLFSQAIIWINNGIIYCIICVTRPWWVTLLLTTVLTVIKLTSKVLMHGHQGWNVRHGLCHIYMIYVYIWVVHSFCLFCCLFIIVTTQFVALYEPCKPKPKPKPSTYDTRTTTPWQRSKFRYLDRSQSNKYAINMQIQTISVSK